MKKYLLLFSLFYLSAVCQPLAFPEAEGFGKYASGGRGGKVVTVTNLLDYTDDNNPVIGSLRWALEQYKHTETIEGNEVTFYEPLTVVFNVSGNIELLRDLKVRRSDLTIAGQSSQGGICITGHSMLFNGATGGEMWYWGPRRKNLIVRYLHFRPTPPGDDTYVTYGTDIENYENVIFDHCTISWANEENLAIYDTKNTTVQWCMIYEGLYKAHHKKGNRSYCGVWGGQFASYHHNLIAHHDSRNVRFNGVRNGDTLAIIDYRNNVIYNWGSNNSAYGLEMKADYAPESRNELNMVNNYYKRGPATTTSNTIKYNNKAHRLVCIDQAVMKNADGDTITGLFNNHYVHGNYVYDFPAVTSNNWYYGVQYKNYPYSTDSLLANTTFRSFTPSPEVVAVWPDELESAEQSFESVLAGAGCTIPYRDWQDIRIVNEVRAGTASAGGTFGAMKGIIDTPSVVLGYPEYKPLKYVDSDLDGMPDQWEIDNSLNAEDPTDGPIIQSDGYSNLERYLNGIEQNPTALKNTGFSSSVRVLRNTENGSVRIESDKIIRSINIYDVSGKKLGIFTSTEFILPQHNNLLLLIDFDDNSQEIVKIL